MSEKFEFAIEILQTELLNLKATVRRIERNEHEVMTNMPKENEFRKIDELTEAIKVLGGAS